jgi:hypothetical protein
VKTGKTDFDFMTGCFVVAAGDDVRHEFVPGTAASVPTIAIGNEISGFCVTFIDFIALSVAFSSSDRLPPSSLFFKLL